jgi:hypothetical protein
MGHAVTRLRMLALCMCVYEFRQAVAEFRAAPCHLNHAHTGEEIGLRCRRSSLLLGDAHL